MDTEIRGNIVDVIKQKTYAGIIKIEKGKITDIEKVENEFDNFIIPGFIDAHVHIESSMLTPSEFARVAAIHGTVAVVTDPHEIANILGIDGVYYMVDNASKVPFKFYFGAPSCVPASPFETSGAELNPKDVEKLLKNDNINFLAEMMNYPGVLNNDTQVIEKINSAKKYSKPIDGHAPGLTGKDLEKYVECGISTDHECFKLEEGREKINLGMKVLLREGTGARNFNDLQKLIEENVDSCMLCSDDKHPNDLIKGHINLIVKRAIENGIDPFKVLKAASVNPISHYNLDVGLLRIGDPADFIVVDDLRKLNVLNTYINGTEVARNGTTLITSIKPEIKNNFNISFKKPSDFSVKKTNGKINTIVAIDGQLITKKEIEKPLFSNDLILSDIDRDILKISVVNRYKNTKPSVGFIKNFGLKKGAIASSVAHDSHNIIVVGITDEEICKAVNLLIENKGGLCAVEHDKKTVLPLPIAGIISNKKYDWVAKKYEEIEESAKSLGSNLHAPFMTLSFMALPVIPKLKITDKGLFDSENFKFISLFT
ncbi:MAG: adenosine deaminase [Thermoplasmatales archaeon SG8-52-3]|nr:MAG: adenosine deaminase [Thermoplasmatales archaeon SG8-52-3]